MPAERETVVNGAAVRGCLIVEGDSFVTFGKARKIAPVSPEISVAPTSDT
jgi:hypothetical protein